MVSRQILGIVALGALATTLWPAPAHADDEIPLLRDSYYEVGPIYWKGGISFNVEHDPFTATGVHIYERNGIGGKLVATSFVAILLAMGRSDTEYLGSSYGVDYRVDYYRVKSPEEIAAEDAARSQAIDDTAANEYQMDVQIFWPHDDDSKAKGWSWSVWPFSWTTDYFTAEVGILMERISGPFCKDPMTMELRGCRYSNFGTPIRIAVPITRFALADIQWDANWLALGDDSDFISHSSPLRASLTLQPIDRLFVRGGLMASTTDTEKLGVVLEAGVRF